MRDLHQILKLWQALEDDGQSAVMATVVRTEGSSYRLPGARLLIARDGRHAGSVSGGCLEDDLRKRAWWLTENGALIRRYDTTADGEIATDGYGLGCNGVIHVLLERVTSQHPSVVPLLRLIKERRQPVSIEHVIGPAQLVGARRVRRSDGVLLSDFGAPGPSSEADLDLFIEQLVPPTRLLLFGAGDDAVPVAELAKYLGWDVLVFDGRRHYASAKKFAAADSVSVREAGSPLPPVDRWTAAVIMNHSYSQDLDVLKTLAGEPLAYLGLLGPRKRTLRLLSEAGLMNTSAEHALAVTLYAPMGLETGGDAPEQVALAVISEIQAVLHGKPAGFLRDREGPIHSPDSALGDEAKWVRSIVCA